MSLSICYYHIYIYGLLFLFQDDSEDDNQPSSNSTSKMNTRASICISSDDEDCPAPIVRKEVNGIPGTSGSNSGPGTSSTRGISGQDEVSLARHNGTSSLDEDNYSSYLTLLATISEDSSEDEGLQQAMAARMESHM